MLSLFIAGLSGTGRCEERARFWFLCGVEPGAESRTQMAQGCRGTRRRHPGGDVGAVACVPSKGPLTVARRTESGTAETPTVRSTPVPALAGETSGRLQVPLCRPPDPGCAATVFTPVPLGPRTWGPCGPAPGLLPHVQAQQWALPGDGGGWREAGVFPAGAAPGAGAVISSSGPQCLGAPLLSRTQQHRPLPALQAGGGNSSPGLLAGSPDSCAGSSLRRPSSTCLV